MRISNRTLIYFALLSAILTTAIGAGMLASTYGASVEVKAATGIVPLYIGTLLAGGVDAGMGVYGLLQAWKCYISRLYDADSKWVISLSTVALVATLAKLVSDHLAPVLSVWYMLRRIIANPTRADYMSLLKWIWLVRVAGLIAIGLMLIFLTWLDRRKLVGKKSASGDDLTL